MAKKSDSCFVIMPFSETSSEHTEKYWTEHFNSILKPHIEKSTNLKAHRSEPLREDILRQIITNLVTSPVVVADLTDNNSNVYWELGIRQSFKHGTVTIAEEGTDIPFDVGGKGTLFYNPKNHLNMEKFYRKFKKAIKDCLSNPKRPDSSVLETISGRGTLFEIINRDESIRRLDAVLSEHDRNLQILNKILETGKKNKENPTKRSYETLMFRTPSIELLITNRYIDKDQAFYKPLEHYLDWLIALNHQESKWKVYPASTELWFFDNEKSAKNVFKRLKDTISSVHKEIESKY